MQHNPINTISARDTGAPHPTNTPENSLGEIDSRSTPEKRLILEALQKIPFGEIDSRSTPENFLGETALS